MLRDLRVRVASKAKRANRVKRVHPVRRVQKVTKEIPVFPVREESKERKGQTVRKDVAVTSAIEATRAVKDAQD